MFDNITTLYNPAAVSHAKCEINKTANTIGGRMTLLDDIRNNHTVRFKNVHP